MKLCEYCGEEIQRPKCTSHEDWSNRRFCNNREAKLALHRGSLMSCGHCCRRFNALQGWGCFCSQTCGEAYQERERLEAARQFDEWRPRAAAA